jgi:hypothetical protein
MGPKRELRDRSPVGRRAGARTLLLGFAIFGFLWILHIPLRKIYVPNEDDISHFVDSLLLAPDARWQDWFTRGYWHDFDLYPDWPVYGSEFARMAYSRPVFEFLIYLAHFVLGRDWAAYLLINCFAAAGMGAVAFQIARTVLGLRTGSSLVVAMLVILSPPLWVVWVSGVGFAIEPLATVLVAGAFLAVLAHRDFVCLALLFLAVLTKENALWAPLAAAITIMVRPKQDESLRHRVFAAGTMILPVVMWLGLRLAFFGGIGGTRTTAGYTPVVDFLKLTLFKLTHLHYLFIPHKIPEGEWSDRGTIFLILDRGTALLIYPLLFLWVLRILREAADRVRLAMREMRWPTVDAGFLVTLWAAIALAFHFALPLGEDRYATSVVVFAWPALVAEVEKRGKVIIWVGFTALCAVSLTRTSYSLFERIAGPVRNEASKSMDAVLVQAPIGTRQVYVLSAGGLQEANPEYLRLILGMSAEIVRVAEINFRCRDASDFVDFDHRTADGVVSVTLTAPACANFSFFTNRFNSYIANGRLYRNNAMSYELPEVDPTQGPHPSLFLGRRMTVHFRPNGPVRFIIEHGRPNGIAWFDTPSGGGGNLIVKPERLGPWINRFWDQR